MAMMIRGYQLDPCVECGFFCSSFIVSRIGVQIPEDEAILDRWYILLDHILQQKICERAVKKRESTMPFTMFQTPWKAKEVDDVFSVSLCRFVCVEWPASLVCRGDRRSCLSLMWFILVSDRRGCWSCCWFSLSSLSSCAANCCCCCC